MVLSSKIVLAVGAHPDDIELGCGGTLYKSVQAGAQVIALYMTRGGKMADTDVRIKESTEAMRVLGVNEVCFEDFPDTEVPCSHKAIARLEEYALKYRPDVILTHSLNDTHQDHRQVAWLSMSAFRNIPKILAYETPRVMPAAFSPTYFIDITGCAQKKWEALKCHVSQNEKRYLAYESMINLCSFRGSQAGVKEAEAFEVIRYLESF
jgi:LmbE family N-acetylglucosaminyl deacetylase